MRKSARCRGETPTSTSRLWVKRFKLINGVAFRALEFDCHLDIVASRSSDRDGRVHLVSMRHDNSAKNVACKRHNMATCVIGVCGVNLVFHDCTSPPSVRQTHSAYARGVFPHIT